MKTKTETRVPVPTQKQIDSMIADVAALTKRVEAFTVTLSTAERLASLKMRAGGEQVVATVGQLAEQHKVSIPEISVSSMNTNLQLAKRLRPLADAVQQLERRLDDTIITANSRCWAAATALYTILSRSMSANPTIEVALRPIVAFFSLGARKKNQPTPANDSASKPQAA